MKGDRFLTFSVRFEDAEYDETPYQRSVAAMIGSDHRELAGAAVGHRGGLPAVVAHAERPLLRTAPAPLFLLSGLVRESGIKVVLTGEGADEMFAGYDLFREGKVRRFWGRQPGSSLRPRLLERLYPYLARSPVGQQALAREFFGRGPGRLGGPRLRPSDALAADRGPPAPLRSRVPAGRRGHRRGGAPARARFPRRSRPGRRSPRTSTSRPARSSRATCSRPRAIACSWPTPSRDASPSSTRTWSSSRTRSLPPTSCAGSTRSTC